MFMHSGANGGGNNISSSMAGHQLVDLSNNVMGRRLSLSFGAGGQLAAAVKTIDENGRVGMNGVVGGGGGGQLPHRISIAQIPLGSPKGGGGGNRPASKSGSQHTQHSKDFSNTLVPALPFSFIRRSSDFSRSVAAVFSLSPGEKLFGCGESFTRLDKRG